MSDEQPQSQIDHAAMHAIATRERLMSSERCLAEAIADYHVNIAQHALHLRHILKQTRYYPDLMTDDARKAIAHLKKTIMDYHVQSFGMDPSWPTSPKADKDL